MALQKTTTKEVFGEILVFADTYHEVVSVSGDKLKMNACITIYKDNSKEVVIDNFYFSFTPNITPNAKNLFEEAYERAKELDDYADAVDC